MTAGPSVTTYIAGNRQNTSGNTSLTPIFCARLLGALAALRPAHLRMRAQRLRDARAEPIRLHQHRHQRRTSSTFVRSAKFLNASIRGLPARISVVMIRSSSDERRVRHGQLLGRLHDGLIEAHAGLDADDQQVERIGQAVCDQLLSLLGLPRQPEARHHVADDRHQRADQQALRLVPRK